MEENCCSTFTHTDFLSPAPFLSTAACKEQFVYWHTWRFYSAFFFFLFSSLPADLLKTINSIPITMNISPYCLDRLRFFVNSHFAFQGTERHQRVCNSWVRSSDTTNSGFRYDSKNWWRFLLYIKASIWPLMCQIVGKLPVCVVLCCPCELHLWGPNGAGDSGHYGTSEWRRTACRCSKQRGIQGRGLLVHVPTSVHSRGQMQAAQRSKWTMKLLDPRVGG